ncbi:MAG: glycosyltransferase family 2 protein [Vicinamibacterales bacterium]
MGTTIANRKPAQHAAAVPEPVLPGLSICIPVYDEENAVAETLERCLGLGENLRRQGVERFEVIAVDDGSHDASADVIQRFADVRLIRHGRNRGYGAALKTGFAAARYDLIGFLDADATYPPEQFPRLCAAVLQGADLVVGSRMAGADSQMPAVRRLGNTVFAHLLTLMGRTPVTDTASGMRVFRREVLNLLSPLPDGLNLTPVMSARALHEGIVLTEVAIPYRERVGESKLNVARDGVRFVGTMVEAVLSYNPVRILGFAGLAGVALALAVFAGLVAARAQGVTTLGPLGTFAVFAALVCGVAGVSTFALGATFNYVVSLFYDRPIRQGLFRKPLFERPIERMFLPAGLAAGAVGLGLSVVSLTLALRGWPIDRLWLYLTASAMAMLVGVQLVVWWVMASVLQRLSLRTVGRSADIRG